MQNLLYLDKQLKINTMKDRKTAILLCFFLGGIGVHRFYLGQTFRGVICIPLGLIIAPFTAIYWLLTSEESFDNNYNKQRIQRELLNKLK